MIGMSISTDVGPHLPYLRRFARALTGSQKSGDAYVVALLESLLQDPAGFPAGRPAKVALYRAFLRVWNSVEVNVSERAEAASRRGEQATNGRLEAITPRVRQAFLLSTVEVFSREQTAQILDTDLHGVAQLIAQAGREIGEQLATDILIIEDEPLIAMDLALIAESLGHRVVGRARTHREAVAAVADRRPGLVLADIQLADGSSGLEAANEILKSIQVPIVFITAYPERLLTGQRPEPTFLITKPFDTEMVKAIVSQALFFEPISHRQWKASA